MMMTRLLAVPALAAAVMMGGCSSDTAPSTAASTSASASVASAGTTPETTPETMPQTAPPAGTDPATTSTPNTATASTSQSTDAAGASVPPSPQAIDIAATIEASKSEGGLLIYGSPNDDQMKPILDAFAVRYPWIRVQYLSLGGADTFQRYLTEVATNSQTADLVIDNQAVGILDLVARGQIVDYVDPTLAALPDFARLGPGVVAMSEDPLIAVFNKAILPEDKQPTTLAALADYATSNPGRVETYAIEHTLGYAGTYAYLAENGEAGWSILDKIGANAKVEDSGAAAVNKISQGEYSAGFFQSGSIRALMVGDAAAVLNWRYLTDATPVIPRAIAVTTASKAPNSAKVFVNYVLSVEGQTAACAGGFTPYRDGVTCEFDLQSVRDAVGADKVLVGTFDPAMASDQQAIVDRWNKAFGR